jgi:hypothetical protein
MRTTTFIRLAAAGIACLVVSIAFGATIPAGTTLVVKTLHNISSVDRPGTQVRTQLAHDIGVNGKVVLPAGTKISGRVETSKSLHASKQDLTVNITELQIHGRKVAIKTTGAVNVLNPMARTTRRGVHVSTYSYQVPPGTTVQFRLAQPLDI